MLVGKLVCDLVCFGLAELTFLSLVLGTASGGLRLQAASSLATSVPEAITRLSTEAALLRAMQARCAAKVPSSAWKSNH